MKQNSFKLYTVFLIALVFSACSKKKADSQAVLQERPSTLEDDRTRIHEQVEEMRALVVKHDLFHYPALTAFLATEDAAGTQARVLAEGGKIVYNPNLNRNTRIPFLIVNLPPEKLLDSDFVTSLNLSAVNLSLPDSTIKPQQQAESLPERAFEETVYVPTADVHVPEFVEQYSPDELLGENVTVAVIDTGVDALHPVFQDRVVYWSDQTEETQVTLSSLQLDDGNQVQMGERIFELPEDINRNDRVFTTFIDESKMSSQSGDAARVGNAEGIDLNGNGHTQDRFPVLMGKSLEKESWVAYVAMNESENLWTQKSIEDFNQVRSREHFDPREGMLYFATGNRPIAYPLLLNVNEEEAYLRLGVSDGSHGTHVAGIIAGDGAQIQGVAPRAKIMSLKVCSAISCTTDAILRALVESFYNPVSLIPDVVNISLGSHQQYSQDVFDYLMRDLAAKFGTTFVISASNSGPGHRSINSIGALAPIIQVGAHVSANTLSRHYGVDPSVTETMPEHNLLFFSSVGPSYTGHLRPNVIAPGSSLSATSLRETGSEKFNGTSMSAPLVAGSVAALLSVAKKDEALESLWLMKRDFLESLKNPREGATFERSLLGLPLLVRSALENTAERLDQYTSAQQGHGLIHVNNAYPELRRLAQLYQEERSNYFELLLNGNAKSTRAYKRDLGLQNVAAFHLELEQNSERGFAEQIRIRNTPITVHLNSIEIQNPKGTVKRVDLSEARLPFSLGTAGIEGQQSLEETVLLASNRMRAFFSVRRLDLMKPGNTYVAHYDLKQGGERVETVLDVVHVPEEFSEQPARHEVPGISSETLELRNALSWSNRRIAANNFHHYFIAVDEMDSALDIDFALAAGQVGALYFQLYDPDGREVEFDTLWSSRENTPNRSHMKTKVNVQGQPGVYELTVAASNARWMGPTRYDLLVVKDRFKLSEETLHLTAGLRKMLTVSHPNSNNTLQSVALSAFHPVMSVDNVPVLPSRWTFQPLDLSSLQGNLKSITAFVPRSDSARFYFGRMDHRLFRLAEGDRFEEVATANTERSHSMRRVFTEIPEGDEPLYVAFETYGVLPEEGTLGNASTQLPLKVLLEQDVESETSLTAELLSSSQADLSLVELRSEERVATELPEELLGGFLELERAHGAVLKLPVYLRQ